jgi:polar amino acid transport system substrate-binding protein
MPELSEKPMASHRYFLRILTGMVVAACALSASAQNANESNYQRVERTKALRVGVIAGAIPYFNKNLTTGKWDGFGPDFGESLAKSMGAKAEFVETTWGNAVLDLQSNKIDVMFGLAPSPARREAVNFSDTLFENTYTVVCRKDYPQKTWAQFNSPDSTIALDVGLPDAGHPAGPAPARETARHRHHPHSDTGGNRVGQYRPAQRA